MMRCFDVFFGYKKWENMGKPMENPWETHGDIEKMIENRGRPSLGSPLFKDGDHFGSL